MEESEKKNGICEVIERKAPKKLSRYYAYALTLKREHPAMSQVEIGRKLKEIGLSKNAATITQRLNQNMDLREEFRELDRIHQKQIACEDYPLARKVLRKALKSKELPIGQKAPFVKLIYDKRLADKQEKSWEAPVSIAHIEQLQVLVQGDFSPNLSHITAVPTDIQTPISQDTETTSNIQNR